jgi:ABC-type glycerol-3-phosphate transport system substrate-binding protein
MRRIVTAIALSSALVLTGCTTAADPGDKEACTVWSEAQQAMLQTVAVIAEVTQNPNDLAEDIVAEFNKVRNELLVAYDKATKLATSPDLKSALEEAFDADSVIYYDLAGATAERMQASIAAVGTVVSTCLISGIDVSSVLGTGG